MPERGLVVLDMAGTTIAATDQVPRAMIAAFAQAGLELRPDDVAALRGRSKREAIRECVRRLTPDPAAADELSETIFGAFQTDLVRRYQAGVSEIPGALDAIRRLRAGGWAVALTTGFDRTLADLLLERLGWHGEIDTVVTADDVRRGRPSPDLVLEAMRRTGTRDASRVIVVGDTTADLEAAGNAAVDSAVAVLTGAHDRDALARHGPAVILDSVAGLPAWLARRETPDASS